MTETDISAPAWIEQISAFVQSWLFNEFLLWRNVWPAAAIAAALTAALIVSPRLRRATNQSLDRRLLPYVQKLDQLTFPLTWALLQWCAVGALAAADLPRAGAQAFAGILTAWCIIRIVASILAGGLWSRILAALIWFLAAMQILGVLNKTLDVMNNVALTLGDTRISMLMVLKAAIVLTVLLWLAQIGSRFIEKRLAAQTELTPSVQVLYGKISRLGLFLLAAIIGLNSIGLDLTGFAVLSGAVGVGVGFGLQKVVSNLVSGVILLLDKSIKPGDVISVGDTYGWISSLGARYVSVVTRDGIEHLIPNEELITRSVENWSYSNNRVRLRVPVGISYESDVRKALSLCEDAACAAPRIIADPPPRALFMGFGADSIDLELRCWIDDPQNGAASARSEVLLEIWDRFRANGIEVPYSQQDVHIRSLPPGFGAAPQG